VRQADYDTGPAHCSQTSAAATARRGHSQLTA
jgi:hypothetical protein